MSALCLLGAWHSGKAADRAIVAGLADQPYEAIERKRRKLALADDAPVISIGQVRRAKAPLELLELYAERLTSAEPDRYFEIVESLLIQPDPSLELAPDRRWMAQVYAKVRAGPRPATSSMASSSPPRTGCWRWPPMIRRASSACLTS